MGPTQRRTRARIRFDSKLVREQPSVTVDQAHPDKIAMYAPLIAIANKQKMDGKRTYAPVFAPVALTTFLASLVRELPGFGSG